MEESTFPLSDTLARPERRFQWWTFWVCVMVGVGLMRLGYLAMALHRVSVTFVVAQSLFIVACAFAELFESDRGHGPSFWKLGLFCAGQVLIYGALIAARFRCRSALLIGLGMLHGMYLALFFYETYHWNAQPD